MNDAPLQTTLPAPKVALLTRGVIGLTIAFLGLIALVVGALLLIGLLVGAWFLYCEFVPAYSTTFHVREIDTTVTLKFYWVTDEMHDNGRRVTIATPSGAVTARMCGYDWAHWARTGVYLTADRNIALLGWDSCDYLVSLPDRQVTRAWKMPSDKWKYLGAFDFVGYPRGYGERVLRFIPAADQAECIEMGGEEPLYDWMVRRTARNARCPWFQPANENARRAIAPP